MNRLPSLEFETDINGIPTVYVNSSLDSSHALLQESVDVAIDARERLMYASTFLSDFLRYRSDHPEEHLLQSVDALQDALRVSMGYVRGLVEPTELSVAHGNEEYYREFDSFSAAAFVNTDVTRLNEGIKRIVGTNKDTKYHFLPMANSALPITLLGWDIISRGFEDKIDLHPVLFSRSKMDHQLPQITEAEMEFFRDSAARGDEFIIFEEDTQSGDTVQNMMNFLVRHSGARFSQIHGLTPSYSRNGQHAVLNRGSEGLEAEII